MVRLDEDVADAGIDLAFEADPSLSSLAFCRRRVEQLAAGATRATPRPTGHEAGRPSLPELAERLAAEPSGVVVVGAAVADTAVR